MEKMSRIKIIKKFFEQDGGTKVRMDELKNLSKNDRDELAALAAVEMGVEVRSD